MGEGGNGNKYERKVKNKPRITHDCLERRRLTGRMGVGIKIQWLIDMKRSRNDGL